MIVNGVRANEISGVEWQKARASINNGNCVEVTSLPEGGVAVRNSKFPGGPALVFSKAELAAFLDGAKGEEFDHLVA
ncbi:hypothetical protein GCM10012285_41560 [Streptomyces kronopolitis]|uniref:DUF397 domain-containing protein n=1 Tax=Streptomyces kronopolitis TaxID=1612435 RepID=A0ABQ2JQS4_9ACTN|nr:DUF397 domain-containing protein [Streptomyces kronopolitis]GGN51442.1 hypothetical protein GCM10012285_41560 [Streptomyces kronopolitis]